MQKKILDLFGLKIRLILKSSFLMLSISKFLIFNLLRLQMEFPHFEVNSIHCAKLFREVPVRQTFLRDL